MSTIDHATAVAHVFEDCSDPDCGEVLCEHYRAGFAAGRDFMQDTAARLDRVRAAARGAGGEKRES